MAVSVHVAPHPDALVPRLCDTLADPPDDPFAPELIAVPTRGIERWLTQQIASGLADRGIGDGIAANIDFPSPRQLVREVLLGVPELAASVAGREARVRPEPLAAADLVVVRGMPAAASARRMALLPEVGNLRLLSETAPPRDGAADTPAQERSVLSTPPPAPTRQ